MNSAKRQLQFGSVIFDNILQCFVARRSEKYIQSPHLKFRASPRLIKSFGFFFAFTNEKGYMISIKEHKLNGQDM